MSESPKPLVGVPKFYGLYEAVVVDNNDPKKLNRVKVRITEIAGQLPSTWAAVAAPFASPNAGNSMLPENNAFVFVQFLAGDVNRPVVVGGSWKSQANRSQIPEATYEAESDMKGARGQDTAQTALGGTIQEPADQRAPQYPHNKVIHTEQHLLELDDTSGAERISITHKKGTAYIDIYKDGSMVMGLSKGLYLVAGAASAEHVKGQKDVVVDADYTLKSQNQKIEALNRTAQVQKEMLTAMSLMWEIASQLNIQAGGPATIKAPLVNVGPGVLPGAVVTVLTHPIDYITGIPIVGNPTVLVG
jgi:uncharacterized protein involved in type VI secretion and phage assembly